MSFSESWFEEKQSAWLYAKIARRERDPVKQSMFRGLEQAAEAQARIWEAEMAKAGQAVPEFRPTPRARVVGGLLRVFGVKPLRPGLAAMKVRGLSVYRGPIPPTGHPMPTSVEEVGGRHRGYGGGGLRAAVFGINDGLVSNTALIMGVAGASDDVRMILTAGIAGLLAGALSMAAGEYVSMRSQREMFEYQIGLERDELAEYPEQEAEELALIYAARGMQLDEARRVSSEMLRNPEGALDVLAREELGLNPEDLGSPWAASAFSFFSFALGAVVPLAPFLSGLDTTRGTLVAAVLAGLGLFMVGAVLSLFTGRRAYGGGFRMLFLGGMAALITFLIGNSLGINV